MATGASAQDLGPRDCVRGAEAVKEAGNAALRRGSNEEALAKYREGLELLSLYYRKVRLKSKDPDLQQRSSAAYLALQLNAAQACLKLWDFEGAAYHADRVLQIDQRNMKALYRRAVARSHSDNTLEQACADFARVLELDPENKEARQQLERTKGQLQTFYDLLNAHSGFTQGQLRHAYLREAKRWHPDKANEEDKELSERRFKAIAEAHEVLKDDQLRQHYDLFLQCRRQGYVEFEDVEGRGEGLRLPFKDWPDFRKVMEHATSADVQQELARRAGRGGWRQPEEPAADDPNDPPISMGEWLMAGGVCLAIWWFSAWRHSRRQWLKAMPLEIWTVHEEYSMPLGLLLSPLFFGNVPFEEATRWLQQMVGQTIAQV